MRRYVVRIILAQKEYCGSVSSAHAVYFGRYPDVVCVDGYCCYVGIGVKKSDCYYVEVCSCNGTFTAGTVVPRTSTI
jgi:hypothetical protein